MKMKIMFMVCAVGLALFAEEVPSTMTGITRTDWAAGTYKQLTSRAAKSSGIPIMFLGDSITMCWEFSPTHQYPGGLESWNKHFKPMGAENYGVSGDMVQHVLWRVTEGKQLACLPKLIVLMIGTNNLHQKPVSTPKEIADGIDYLLTAIQSASPKSKILLLGILPRSGTYPVAETNAFLPEIAKKHGAAYFDAGPALLQGKATVSREIFRDGLHFSPAGYELFAQLLKPEIEKLLAEK